MEERFLQIAGRVKMFIAMNAEDLGQSNSREDWKGWKQMEKKKRLRPGSHRAVESRKATCSERGHRDVRGVAFSNYFTGSHDFS